MSKEVANTYTLNEISTLSRVAIYMVEGSLVPFMRVEYKYSTRSTIMRLAQIGQIPTISRSLQHSYVSDSSSVCTLGPQ